MTENNDRALSRGQFLAGAASPGGAAIAAGVLPGAAAAAAGKTPPADASEEKRTYTGGRFQLEVDGAVSELQFHDGMPPAGLPAHEVPLGPDNIQKKHIANVKWQACSMEVGLGGARQMYNWIKASFDKGGADLRKNGAVVAADYNYREVSRVSFTDAVISEVTIPALDAASKDAAKMTVTFGAQSVQRTTGGAYKIDSKKQKQWLPANFRVHIDGVDTPRVTKVDSFTIKQAIEADEKLRTIKVPGRIEFPNLTIHVPEPAAGGVNAWFEDFVLNGNNGDSAERNGSIELLAPDNRTVLATISLSNVGITRVAPDKVEAGQEAVRKIKCELYVERMALTFSQTQG